MTQNIIGDTPLHLAVRGGDLNIVDVFVSFLRYGERSDFQEDWFGDLGIIPDIEKSVRVRNRNGDTALHEAVRQQEFDAKTVVTTFVKLDHEVCYLLNNEGKSPLFLAADARIPCCFADMLGLLKLRNVQERLKGPSPFLPIVLKTSNDLIDTILEYEQTFISLLDEDGKTPLHYAASNGCIDMIQYILGKKVEYSSLKDNNGFLPIHLAAAHGKIKAVMLLLKHCIGPKELLTSAGQSILHVAAACGKNNVVRFVLETSSLECLINDGDVNGNTALHLATMNWQTMVVFTMTWDKRVDLRRVNAEGFTPFDTADYYMEQAPSFDKRLTWAALKASSPSKTPGKENLEQCLGDPSKLQTSNVTDKDQDIYKDRVNTLLLVATLVATVTFAAGFTVPGGYNNTGSDQGMATMLRNNAFFIFIICDTIAMYTSILVVISLIWAQLGDINLVDIALQIAIPLLGASLAMMLLAFLAGVYLVTSQVHWLAYSVLITGLTSLGAFLLLFFPLCFPICSSNHALRYLSYYPFQFFIKVISLKP